MTSPRDTPGTVPVGPGIQQPDTEEMPWRLDMTRTPLDLRREDTA